MKLGLLWILLWIDYFCHIFFSTELKDNQWFAGNHIFSGAPKIKLGTLYLPVNSLSMDFWFWIEES